MKLSVILNAGAAGLRGAAGHSSAQTVNDLLRESGWTVDLRVVTGDQIRSAADHVAEDTADIVVAGGGDGTIAAVAGALAGTRRVLGVLPLGTFNHFARDLRIPLDLADAVRVLHRGRPQAVDLGEVNGCIFINNASLGAYPRLVVKREDVRQVVGSKPLATTMAAVSVATRMPLLRLRLDIDTRAVLLPAVPFVFIGNNAYAGSLFSRHWRERLDGGTLWVYTARSRSTVQLAWMALRTLLRRPPRPRDFVAQPAREVVVRTVRRHMRVALDGEVLTLRAPLRHRIRPGALRVMVPA